MKSSSTARSKVSATINDFGQAEKFYFGSGCGSGRDKPATVVAVRTRRNQKNRSSVSA